MLLAAMEWLRMQCSAQRRSSIGKKGIAADLRREVMTSGGGA